MTFEASKIMQFWKGRDSWFEKNWHFATPTDA